MKQILPELRNFLLFTLSNDYYSVSGGANGLASTWGTNVGRTPVPWACAFRNIAIYCQDASLATDLTLTLRKNGVDTALTVTLPLGQTYATTTGIAVACAAGDDVDYHLSGTATGNPGYTAAFCIEHEGPGNYFAIGPDQSGKNPGSGHIGGAFGNGGFQSYTGQSFSNSGSICAVPGSVTHLALCDLRAGASGGSWTGYIKKNGVLQDGTGGTVDTSVTLLDAEATRRVVGTFSLPVAVGDICDVVLIRNTTTVTIGNTEIGAGIGFTPTTDGWFMITGGDNTSVPGSGTTTYAFTGLQGTTSQVIATVPIGPIGITLRGMYVIRGSLPSGSGPGSGETYTHTLLQGTADPYVAGSATAVEVAMADTTSVGFVDGLLVSFSSGSSAVLRVVPSSGASVSGMYWGLAASFPDVEGGSSGNGIIGPLIWVVINRLRQPAGTHSADAFSDLEMQDPATYYGSYKQPFLLHAGDAERALSDPLTGDVVSSTFQFTLGDQDDIDNVGVGRLRSLLASEIDRYWTLPAWFFCTTRANRAVLGLPFTAFAGNIVNLQPVSPRALEITLGDILTERIVNDKLQLPWRLIRDGFLDELDYVTDKLDLEQPEPILYGTFDRVVGEDGSPAASGQTGFRIEPIYLGIETVSGDEQHVWMVAGQACKSVTIQVDGEERDESDNWFVSMEDRTSSTYGTTRRYTLIRAPFGGGTPRWRSRQSEGDSVAIGDKMLTVSVEGAESNGDGTGTLLTDFYQQYKHFTVNYLANAGPASYHSGAWLSSPQWTNPNGSVIDVVDEDTFDDASTIGAERLDGGLIGAIAIGLTAGDRSGPSRWVAEFNRCGFCQSGPTQPFRWGITTIHPTQDAKDAAIHYTDAYEVLEGSFSTAMEWDRHATHFPWRTDYEHTSGDWKSSGVVPSSEAGYYEHKDARTREYLFIPGAEAGEHIATLEAGLLANPPRLIRFDAPIGPDAEDDSLAYRNPGDYITYEHFDAVSEQREVRLAYVQRVGVRGSARRAYIVAMDVDDLINFDIGGSPGGSP